MKTKNKVVAILSILLLVGMPSSLYASKQVDVSIWVAGTAQLTQNGAQYINGLVARVDDRTPNGSQTQSWEFKITGTAPATTLLSVQGCMRGGTCGTATTSTSTSSVVLTSTGLWDFYNVQVTWTGGSTSTTVTVNDKLSEARTGSGGTGSGVVTANNGAANVMAIYPAAGGSTTVSPDPTLTDDGNNLTYGGTLAVRAPTLVATGPGASDTQVEIADPGGPGANTGSLYSSTTFQRWAMYNHNAGPKVAGTWMVTSTGGLQVGGSTQVGGINTEILVPGNTVTPGLFTEDASGAASWTATNTIEREPMINVCGGTVGVANGASYIFFPSVLSVTTCTATAGTGGSLPIPVGKAGVADTLAVEAGTACTSAATAVTLFVNGAGTALTVTGLNVAAGTIVRDTTHSVNLGATDTYSIKITTGQATETCADLKATFYIHT